MILDIAYLVDDTHTDVVLQERARSVFRLEMEVQDSLQDVLDVLNQQNQPVILLLPPSGDTFHRPEHFLTLRSFLSERDSLPFLCLVIPSHRTREAALATHYGIDHVSSLEEALQSIAHVYRSDDLLTGHPLQIGKKTSSRITEAIPKVEKPSLENTSSFLSSAQKWPLGLGTMVVLLLTSVIVVPLLLIPTQSIAHPSGVTTTPIGTLTFTSSGQFDLTTTQGYNDIMTLSLHSLPASPPHMLYDVWLLPDPGDDITPPLLIASIHAAGPVNVTYHSPTHTNLLAFYSGVRITVQQSNPMPDTLSQNPADWRWQGNIPDVPTPGDENHYTLLSHLRHLLAKDPTLQDNQIPGGLTLWLTRNVAKVEEWASAAQGDWHGVQTSRGDASQIHNHMLRVLEYLDGLFYYTRDVPTGSPWLVDPQAGKIGLLNSVPNQNPPGYLAHIDIHLTGLTGAPGHTRQQQQLAIQIDTVINKMRTDLLQVRSDAIKLVNMNTQQLQQQGNEATVNEMATLTTEVKSGWFDPSTGENIGGVLWITSRLQQLTAIEVSPLSPTK